MLKLSNYLAHELSFFLQEAWFPLTEGYEFAANVEVRERGSYKFPKCQKYLIPGNFIVPRDSPMSPGMVLEIQGFRESVSNFPSFFGNCR